MRCTGLIRDPWLFANIPGRDLGCYNISHHGTAQMYFLEDFFLVLKDDCQEETNLLKTEDVKDKKKNMAKENRRTRRICRGC